MKRTMKRSTPASADINSALTVAQLVTGVPVHPRALTVDAVHSLSDLVSDFVILFAGHHSQKGPDAKHHYGHLRFGTAASLVLGLLILTVGVKMLWGAVAKLEHPESISHVKLVGLWIALGALVSKELLFRYTLAVAECVRSSMLIANAWRACSDATSSLVVALGIVGNLLGFHLLDPVTASVVGLMVARMGWQFGLNAPRNLMDRAVDQKTASEIREVIFGTPGMPGVHDVRTRRIGDITLIDAHLEIESTVTVKVGRDIAFEARRCIMQRRDALSVMTHVDPVNEPPAGTNQPSSRSKNMLNVEPLSSSLVTVIAPRYNSTTNFTK